MQWNSMLCVFHKKSISACSSMWSMGGNVKRRKRMQGIKYALYTSTYHAAISNIMHCTLATLMLHLSIFIMPLRTQPSPVQHYFCQFSPYLLPHFLLQLLQLRVICYLDNPNALKLKRQLKFRVVGENLMLFLHWTLSFLLYQNFVMQHYWNLLLPQCWTLQRKFLDLRPKLVFVVIVFSYVGLVCPQESV